MNLKNIMVSEKAGQKRPHIGQWRILVVPTRGILKVINIAQ